MQNPSVSRSSLSLTPAGRLRAFISLPTKLRAADLTYVDPADLTAERRLVNPVPWAMAKSQIEPPCLRVAQANKLLNDLGWWDVDPSEVDHDSSQEGLVDADTQETG